MATSNFGRKRRRKPGDLSSLRRSLWAAILTAEGLCDDADAAVRLRALHAMATLAGSYLKTLEIAELEQRIAALEAQAAQPSVRRVA